MGFKEGQLFLDSPNGTYYSGQSIQGKLIFQQEKIQSFRGLYVKLTGFCHVHWTTSHTRTVNGRSESYTIDHDSHEEYINIRVYMLGGEAGEYTIQPGKYEYPFHFRLPENCPSSFEGPYGHIRYEIKAVIDRAYKFNQEKKVMARVMAHLDLNLDPYCREPLQMELQKLYSCCCVSTGLVVVSVELPVAGYCPGQTIPIKLACTNKGRVDIADIKLSITKKTTFIATHEPDKNIIRDKVVEIKKGPISTNTTRNWTVDMIVPAVDVYNILTCQYIRVEYKFKVQVCAKGCHTNAGSSRRIVIGTIPLMRFQDTQPPQRLENPAHHTEPYPNYPPPYPGNSSEPHNIPYNTKSNAIASPDDVTNFGYTAQGSETHKTASQDTISAGPANAYATATAPALDSPENTLPEKK